jgi:hypothetical protein
VITYDLKGRTLVDVATVNGKVPIPGLKELIEM